MKLVKALRTSKKKWMRKKNKEKSC